MVHLTKSTKPVSGKNMKRAWHLLDAKGAVLGRFATDVAKLLIGKHKRTYVSNLDQGDHVIVINALRVEVTGRKSQAKVYSRYSGYPGGLKKVPFKTVQDQKPNEIIRHAVWGMLPKNKLRDRRIARLYIFKDENHPYGDKIKS